MKLKQCYRDLCRHSRRQVLLLQPHHLSLLTLLHSRFVARVVEVFLPRPNAKVNGESTDAAPVASTSASPLPNDQRLPHQIHGDLKIAAKEVNAADDPTKYLYKVQILEEEKPEGRDKHTASTKEARAKWNGSITEVRCNVMRWALL
jgi:bromodomain adjacent to zinc finger domain protein 1A